MKRICITGASGFISKHIIAQLLENGYHVVGTVRDLSAEHKVRFLKDLAFWVNANTTNGAKLELVEADLLAQGSFDAAFAGCDAVLHVASPYIFLPNASEEEARKKIIDPAVEGTKNVFSAIEKNLNTVKRVIFMSSIFAMVNSFSDTIDPVINERSWNSVESIEKAGEAYHFSKTAAEKLAWDLFNTKLKPHGVSMIAVNPAYVIGPALPEMNFLPSSLLEKEKKNEQLLNEGLGIVHDFFTGRKDSCLDINIGLVDVRDVARLIVSALQSSSLHDYDRFLCSAAEMRFIDYCKLLKQLFPQYPIPQQTRPIKGKSGASFKCDTSLAKNRFGMEWMDVSQSSKDMVNSFFALELLEREQKSNTTA